MTPVRWHRIRKNTARAVPAEDEARVR
jgi:hypothetical protein